MNRVFIPFNGVGEVYLAKSNMPWFMHISYDFSDHTEIPFFTLLFQIASLRMRYY